jgi:hypothetical protein
MTSEGNQTAGNNDRDLRIEFPNKHIADQANDCEFREAQRKTYSGDGTDSGFPIHS